MSNMIERIKEAKKELTEEQKKHKIQLDNQASRFKQIIAAFNEVQYMVRNSFSTIDINDRNMIIGNTRTFDCGIGDGGFYYRVIFFNSADPCYRRTEYPEEVINEMIKFIASEVPDKVFEDENFIYLNVDDEWQNGDEYGDNGMPTMIIGTKSTGIKAGDQVEIGDMCYRPRRRKKPCGSAT